MGKDPSEILLDSDADYLISYLKNVFQPSYREFSDILESNKLRLHHVFSFNAIVAHAIDYMVFVEKKFGNTSRTKSLQGFDEKYEVEGTIFIGNKFTLIDAVNNSFKHVELSEDRYKELIAVYGLLSFKSLIESSGKVYFKMAEHRFDYARVILRPVAAIFDIEIESKDSLIDFINGDCYGCVDNGLSNHDYDQYDAIDRMTEYCNPLCGDCGEGGDTCECLEYIFNGSPGESNPIQDPFFDFDNVMSSISPSYDK